MSYPITPRADRLARLHATRDRIEAEIRTLHEAEADDPTPTRAEPERMDAHRRNAERRNLLAWASTPRFWERLAIYGGSSGDPRDPNYRSRKPSTLNGRVS